MCIFIDGILLCVLVLLTVLDGVNHMTFSVYWVYLILLRSCSLWSCTFLLLRALAIGGDWEVTGDKF